MSVVKVFDGVLLVVFGLCVDEILLLGFWILLKSKMGFLGF